ncbi:hypothetical protein SLEP1_g42262 [Rubroshorea leprosula]|uniref:Uncharacterized protein n=1 Tax=Rubroshorea leprosula TaxID=152421 RepID=A0AAV5L986_9ROSI|nr:hypothetical protein SLEP1_g42262 [Rubroshorea leprosula]
MAISISACATRHWTNSSIPPSKQLKFVGQSVLFFIWVESIVNSDHNGGKKRSPGVQLLVDGYIDKFRNYCPVDDVLIRDVSAQVDDEDMAVINHIRSDDWVVMLDEHGLDIGSERFAELVGDAGNKGASRLLFCVGGPYGRGRQIQERANISVIFDGLESSNCTCCACGTTLQNLAASD